MLYDETNVALSPQWKSAKEPSAAEKLYSEKKLYGM